MATYESYKDSGVKWLGLIPNHWDIKRAKTIFIRHKRPVRKQDEIVTCFRDGQVTLRKNRRLEGFTNAAKEFGYQGIRKGDLVIHEMDAFAGSVGVSDSDGKSTPVYSVCTTRNSENSERYYAHIIRVMANLGYILSLSKGIRERSTAFSYDIFGEQLLPIPPVNEQEVIVEYLDKVTGDIDRAIEAQQKMIDALNERKQIIITSAVTRGLNPEAPLRDSGIDWLGQIPEHWEIRKLKWLIDSPLQYGANESPDDFSESLPRYIRITDIASDGTLKKDGAVSLAWNKASKYILTKGDILFARSGATVGKTYLFLDDSPSCFAGYLIKAQCNSLILPEFLVYYTQSSVYENWKNFIFNKATIQNIGADKYSTLLVPLPLVDEQRKILEKSKNDLTPIKQAILNCERMISLLQERKQIIINEVVTGKTKVI